MRRSGDEVGHAPENAGSGGDNAPAAEDLAPATEDPASPQQEAAVGRCACTLTGLVAWCLMPMLIRL